MAFRCRSLSAGLLGAACTVLLCCDERGTRVEEPPSAGVMPPPIARQIELEPGPKTRDLALTAPYAENDHAIAQGKRLYGWYNCSGCHFNGGGGIGPPLMDDAWIYGSDPLNIFRTIIEGRPNGMPAFGGKVPSSQAWQIVAYVRSLGNLSGSSPDPDLSERPAVSASQQSGANPAQDTRPHAQ